MVPTHGNSSAIRTSIPISENSTQRLKILLSHLNSTNSCSVNASWSSSSQQHAPSPVRYYRSTNLPNVPPILIPYLNWMEQKRALRQNVFLIGHAGPLKRALAKLYAQSSSTKSSSELSSCLYEYYYITEQTTDADLKQRKELLSATMQFEDQCVVRAAKHGKVLILEGVENAERNVLALLNGLLEENKMVLDDGTVLCDPKEHQHRITHNSTSDSAGAFVPVHPDFFVICIGLPIPPYTGLPLDPPLRSRFQSKAVKVDENLLALQQLHLEFPRLHRLVLQQIIQFSQFIHAIESEQRSSLNGSTDDITHADVQTNFIPPLPFNHILDLYRIIHTVNKALSISALGMLLKQVYPVHLFLRAIDDVTIGETIINELDRTAKELYYLIHETEQLDDAWDTKMHVDAVLGQICFSSPSYKAKISTLSTQMTSSVTPASSYIPFDTTDGTLRHMFLSHSLNRDFCLVGNVSSGRSTLSQEFCRQLGIPSQTFPLNAEMSTRELFKMRRTDDKGNTYWSNSPLLDCMQQGQVCILDSADLLPADVLMSMQSLIQDRELFLEDGSHYSANPKSNTELRIHPAFRIIAIASSPKHSDSSQASSWLQDRGVLALFHFHVLQPLSRAQELKLVCRMHPKVPVPTTKQLIRFAHIYNAILRDEPVSDKYKSIDLDERHFKPLSLREIIQTAYRLHLFPHSETLQGNILRLTLAESMSRRQQENLLKLLNLLKITAPLLGIEDLRVEESADRVSIGEVSLQKAHANAGFVPKSLFFVENDDHTRVLKGLLKDHLMSLQSAHPVHSLLMGVQGSGKNRITDRFLELISVEKEYLQLHRDTTLHSLTTSPSVQGGVIEYIDSPLIRAATNGRVLVMDEMDKAPSEIVQMLRCLLVDGEMLLPNGKILSSKRGTGENILPILPSFRIIALSNPPNFPFHGNPVFITMGDAFSAHLVQNPTEEQELVILRAYAPHVETSILRKLCQCFSDLRVLVKEEQLSYPYSLRELVNIAIHLEKFPQYGVVEALWNITDFDLFDDTTFQHLQKVFNKHGIPLRRQSGSGDTYSILLGTNSDSVLFDSVYIQYPISAVGQAVAVASTFIVQSDKTFAAHAAHEETSVPLVSHRVQYLSELIYSLPLTCKYPRQVCIVDGSGVHILSGSPDRIYSYNSELTRMRQVELFHYARLSCISLCVLDQTPYVVGLTFDDDHGTFGSRSANIQLFSLNPAIEMHVPLRQSFSFKIAERMSTLNCARSPNSGIIALYTNRVVWLIQHARGGTSKDARATKSLAVLSIELPTSVFASSCVVLRSHAQEHLLLLQDVGTSYLLHVHNGKTLLRLVENSPPQIASLCSQNDSHFTCVEEASSILLQIRINSTNLEVLRSEQKVQIPQSKSIDDKRLIGQIGEKVRVYNSHTAQILDMPLIPQSMGTQANDDNESSDEEGESSGVTSRIQLLDAQALGSDRIMTLHDDATLRIFETQHDKLRQEAQQFKRLILGETSLETEAYARTQNSAHGTQIEDINLEGSASLGMGGAGGFGGFGGSGGSGGEMGFGDREQSSLAPGEGNRNAASMSEEAQQRAREQARQALLRHLKMIEMTEGDLNQYQRHVSNVSEQIARLRRVLQDLKAKEKEKKWLKGRVQGELDENKLVEGLAGEKAIYKKRGRNEEKRSLKHKKKKLLHFNLDCSASMFRFNGFDRRLERMCDVAVLIMEALAGFESKYDYQIVGHSGMSTKFSLVSFSKPPKNRKERLQVVRKLMAHAQYASAGDSTEASTFRAIRSLRRKEADERFLFVFSDANLEAYAFDAKEFSRQIHKHASVETHLIFLASGGEAAEKYAKDLPRRSHLCYSSSELASVFSSIFTASVLTGS